MLPESSIRIFLSVRVRVYWGAVSYPNGMQSAIVLNFPDLSPLIDPWRTATIPEVALGILPYLTLLFPWRQAPLSHSDIQALEAVTHGFRAFELVANRLEQFEDGTLYLSLEDETLPRLMMQTLSRAFPEPPPYSGAFANPMPHITLAKPAPEKAAQTLREITNALHLPIALWVDHIVVVEQQPNGFWQNRWARPL